MDGRFGRFGRRSVGPVGGRADGRFGRVWGVVGGLNSLLGESLQPGNIVALKEMASWNQSLQTLIHVRWHFLHQRAKREAKVRAHKMRSAFRHRVYVHTGDFNIHGRHRRSTACQTGDGALFLETLVHGQKHFLLHISWHRLRRRGGEYMAFLAPVPWRGIL